jgi:hypothetical protein
MSKFLSGIYLLKYNNLTTSTEKKSLCNQCLSPLMLQVRISNRARCTALCDKVGQRLATGQWFSLGPLVSSTNKTDHLDIIEILLKVALSTMKPTNQPEKKEIVNTSGQ